MRHGDKFESVQDYSCWQNQMESCCCPVFQPELEELNWTSAIRSSHAKLYVPILQNQYSRLRNFGQKLQQRLKVMKWCQKVWKYILNIVAIFISRWALAREGDYEMINVCACVSVSRRFLQNYYSYRFFVNVPMNFHALENFWGFMDLGLKISE